MKVHASPSDKTNFLQSLMHMIKGNLGTGILGMPATFSHCGLLGATVMLPVLCVVAAYCVHLLVRASQHLENKMKWSQLDYAELAKGAFKTGPHWIRPFSGAMCRLVDAILVVCQMGICCVYLVFIVDNLESILSSYELHVAPNYLFLAILPVALLLSYIKTLKRLAIASACANVLQAAGLALVVEFLLRDMPTEPKVEKFRPASELALGFGAAMFAFEGISVVLPIYTRMKRPEQMGGCWGLVNFSYTLLLALYMLIGLLGYLRYGHSVADSITLSLPREPLYDLVRAMFTVSLFLSYPLQFYVPNEIIWGYLSARLMLEPVPEPGPAAHKSGRAEDAQAPAPAPAPAAVARRAKRASSYSYACRTALVLFTFVLAVSVPQLNLMMDFFGSISGTALSITLPALIHLVAFWEDTAGPSRVFMLIMDSLLIVFGLFASANGSYFSLMAIIKTFGGAAS